MNEPFSCQHCGSPKPAIAKEGNLCCPDCGTAIPASMQWFVTMPDGKSFGPLTAKQMFDASQRGTLPVEALVRRGDWNEAITHEQLLAQANGAAGEPSQASYSKQFLSNPLGTYFFGPKLAEYQRQQGMELAANRRRHFRRWVFLLVTMFVAASLLPLVAGLIKGDPELALGGAVLGLFAFFWPTIFFLLGMLMYAGAWFEWNWFFRSRTLRHARGMFGDSGARKFYLTFGGVLMVGGAIFSLGSSLIIAGSFLFARNPGVAGRGAGPVAAAEQNVESTRQLFEKNAFELQERLAAINALGQEIANQPNDLELREKLVKAQQRLPKHFADYQLFRDQWRGSVERLQKRVDAENTTSAVLRDNLNVPAELDFTEQVLVPEADQFPMAEVRMATGRLMACQQNWERMQANPNNVPRAAAERLMADLEQQRSFLKSIETKHGYHSQALDSLPANKELMQFVAQADTAKPPRQRDPQLPEQPPVPPAVPGNNVAPRRPNPGGLPLLIRFSPERHTLRGKVTFKSDARKPVLITEAMQEHALFVCGAPMLTACYQFEADLTRLEGEGGFFFVLTLMDRSAALVIDGGDESGHRTGLVAIDNQVLASPRYPEKLLKGTQFPLGKKIHILCTVDGNRVALEIDGNEVYTWQGDVKRLSLPPFYRSEHRRRLHGGSFHSRFQLEAAVIRPQ